MKLKLNRSLKMKLTQALTGLLFDLIDGGIDDVAHTVTLMRALADEIDAQNVQPS